MLFSALPTDQTKSLYILLGSERRGQAPLLSSGGPLLEPATREDLAASSEGTPNETWQHSNIGKQHICALPWQKA